ncbi:MAG: adenosylcobinamide-GDP ribazoletransferase [Rubrivivax sp.]
MILRALTHELRLLLVALQFLTRVPVPAWVGYEPQWLNRSVRHFPLVGVGVGAVGAAVACAAALLWPAPVAATLSVAVTLWLTACFHEDGLADTFDALLGATSRDRALEIMKDSRIGTYGAAALVVALLLRIGLLAQMLRHDPLLAAACLVAGHAAGRAGAVALMATLPYGGDDAHAKAKPLAREVRGSDAAWAVVVGLAALVLVGPASGSAAQAALAVAVAAAGLWVLLAVLRAWLRRRLGGYTGDTLGACQQLGEILVWLVFVAVWV